jgi:ferritin-like metal-binding protein YciE
MSDRTFEEQTTKYLTDVHSIEVQAIEQMRLAPRIAKDAELAKIYAAHLEESQDHERLVRAQLEEHHAAPSLVKDAAGRFGGWGMALFARLNPDSPGKLAMHSYAYEHMELAAYELLRRVAERGGEDAVAAMAATIGRQERAMADRVAAHWDGAVEASLREKGARDISIDLVKHLRDVHALEAQAIQLLEAGQALAGFEALADLFREHLEETREHQRLIGELLSEHNARPSILQNAAMRAGALNLGGFFGLQPDTPIKLAGFAYAFEELEVGAYELLLRVARRAGDTATATTAERILAQERAAAEKIAGTWDTAVDAGLAAQGVPA